MDGAARRDHDADVDNNLLPAERILWEGRPVRHRLLRSTDAVMIPFSLAWCGFAIFWETSVFTGGAPIFFVLWGLPFVVVGLYVVAGRFIVRSVSSRRTRYTLTDKRILIHGGWSGNRLTTAYVKSLPPPVITEQEDGSGSLAFGTFPALSDSFSGGRRIGWRAWSSEPSSIPVFWDIPDVRRVRDFVAHAQSL